MKRRLTGPTLLLGLLAVLTFNVAHADPNGLLEVAEAARKNKKDLADTAYNEMQNANALYSKAGSEYGANQSKINRGVVVTSAKLLAASVTVYMSGGVTATIAVSSLLGMLDLGEAIKDSTSLESAYESAIGAKSSYLNAFESAVSTYNRKYDAYISTLATHTGWTSQQVLNLIGDGSNPAVYHKGSVTPSDVHGGRTRKDWGSYDKSLPSFTCVGPCSNTFTLPSSARTSHQKTCGTAEDVGVAAMRTVPYDQGEYRAAIDRILRSRSASEGCGRKYFDCPDYPDTEHKLQTCRKWLWAYSSSERRDVRSSRCADSFRACMRHTKDHRGTWWSFATSHSASPPDDYMSVGSYLHDPDDPDGIYSTSDETPNCSDCTTHCSSPCGCSTSGTCNGTVSYHTCGVHEIAVSGDHSLQASCSSTDSNGNYCTVTSFYACDSHTHSYPNLVKCGAKNWTGCTARVSSRTEHQVSSCDSCGSTYWTCNSTALAKHTGTETCNRSACRQTWRRCGSTPTCLANSRKTCVPKS